MEKDNQYLNQLAIKCTQGDQHAEDTISELYLLFHLKFRNHFMGRYRLTREIAEDVVQETFVNIFKGCNTFRGDCHFSAWLWKVARNTALGYLRKESKSKNVFADVEHAEDHYESPTQHFESLEDCTHFAFKEFEQFEPERAETVRLTAIEGWSMEEIAEYNDRNLGATREYVSQCRKRFKRFLDDCVDYIKGDA